MPTNSTKAPKASNSSNSICQFLYRRSGSQARGEYIEPSQARRLGGVARIVGSLLGWVMVGALVGQPFARAQTAPNLAPSIESGMGETPAPKAILRTKSRWVPVQWGDLPGLNDDALHEAWNAWIRGCEKPNPAFAPLCSEVRRMSLASAGEQLGWMMARLQPYRIETLAGEVQGLLTGYFEPLFEGSRVPTAEFKVPLYRLPVGLHTGGRSAWYTRQEIDTLPQAQAALRGREIVWLADPIEALVLQIQGSGRVRVTQSDGTQTVVRLGYAGTNGQPYKSVGRWLLDQGEIRDGSWPGIRAWTVANPGRIQNMLWSNPRVVFFKEDSADSVDLTNGPRGAQGVPLTSGRSIAVDPHSIPYGTPVWMVSQGEQISLNRLVQAQDTGSAILGAVRADYFVGTGPEAGELAGRLKQPLQMWALWPR